MMLDLMTIAPLLLPSDHISETMASVIRARRNAPGELGDANSDKLAKRMGSIRYTCRKSICGQHGDLSKKGPRFISAQQQSR